MINSIDCKYCHAGDSPRFDGFNLSPARAVIVIVSGKWNMNNAVRDTINPGHWTLLLAPPRVRSQLNFCVSTCFNAAAGFCRGSFVNSGSSFSFLLRSNFVK